MRVRGRVRLSQRLRARLHDRRDRYGCSSSTKRRQIVHSSEHLAECRSYMADKVYFILKVHVFYYIIILFTKRRVFALG